MHEGLALTVLAELYFGMGRPEQADDYAGRALACHHETGRRPGAVRALALQARIRAAVGDRDAADRLRRAATELATEIGIPVPG